MKKEPLQERGTNNVSIRLPNELIQWIDEQAEKARRSRGSFIRLVLEDLKAATNQPKR
jgi:Arc/MetJ-type ribon-helix-helix transcriptional regulator